MIRRKKSSAAVPNGQSLGQYTQTEDKMPVTRISIREGKSPEYKQTLMDEIYEAMRETVAIKDGDRFMAIAEHGAHEFAYGPFLGSTVAMISYRSRCSGHRARRSLPSSRCTRRSSSGSESTRGSDPRMC